MPVCTKCATEKAQDEFYFVRKRGTFQLLCKACDKIGASARRAAFCKKFPAIAAARSKAWRDRNLERWQAYQRKWLEENRERHREWSREYAKKNPEKFVARTAKREAKKMQAMPSWANEFFMKETYRLAVLRTKVTGMKWVVDHIVPLRSKRVCGLHTHTNLQVVTHDFNQQKSNKWWPDMEAV